MASSAPTSSSATEQPAPAHQGHPSTTSSRTNDTAGRSPKRSVQLHAEEVCPIARRRGLSNCTHPSPFPCHSPAIPLSPRGLSNCARRRGLSNCTNTPRSPPSPPPHPPPSPHSLAPIPLPLPSPPPIPQPHPTDGAIVTATPFDVGVLLISATDVTGTSAFASG